MGNCMFCYPDRIIPSNEYTPTLSGGSWSTSFPLTNLQDRSLTKIARTTNDDNNSTKIQVDLGTERGIGAWALLRHNISLTAELRLSAYSDPYTQTAQTEIYNSGPMPAWLTFYPPDSLPWGHPSLWNGLINTEDRDGYQFDFIRAIGSQVVARYWRLDIYDLGNPDEYVEIGRFILAPAMQPAVNMSYGATVGWSSDVTKTRSLSGKQWIEERSKWRTATCTIAGSTPGQAASTFYDMQRRLGTSGELLFIFDPDDIYQAMWMRSFLANMETLDPIAYPFFDLTETGFSLVEVL